MAAPHQPASYPPFFQKGNRFLYFFSSKSESGIVGGACWFRSATLTRADCNTHMHVRRCAPIGKARPNASSESEARRIQVRARIWGKHSQVTDARAQTGVHKAHTDADTLDSFTPEPLHAHNQPFMSRNVSFRLQDTHEAKLQSALSI